MIDPQVIAKANYNRTLVTVRVSAINSPDWTEIVGTRIDLYWTSDYSGQPFYTNQTIHYKVRAYVEDDNLIPDRTVYARVTMTKNDNTTHTYDFNFVLPYPVLGTIKTENSTQYVTSMRKMDKQGNLSPRNYTNRVFVKLPNHIDVMADEAGDMVIANKWSQTPILVQNITQGTAEVEVAVRANTTIAVNIGDIVRVTEETNNRTFRYWQESWTEPFCKGVSAHVTFMPSMNKFVPQEYANTYARGMFSHFNHNGTITSFPEGSFDLHKFKYAGLSQYAPAYYCFSHFNENGALTSLPEGSFDTSQFTGHAASYDNAGGWNDYSFASFNYNGALTSLPEGSFDFDNVTYWGRGASPFDKFTGGKLTSLPEGSFGFSSIGTLGTAGNGRWLFTEFNYNGPMTSLPAGSFHFPDNYADALDFSKFNYNGALTSLPEHSFNYKITNGKGFADFNNHGALISLPVGSFDTSQMTTAGFTRFNSGGALTSLPVGSFDTSNVTRLDGVAFYYFNANGLLTSLPEGSFKFNAVTSAANNALGGFNQNGALKSLPKGSFNFEHLTSGNPFYGFCADFNHSGALEYLPIGSFTSSSITSVYQTPTESWQSFFYFNYQGKLPKSDTDYNPDFIYPTAQQVTSINAHYYNSDSGTWTTETVSAGNPFKFYEADSFTVTYSTSSQYTTDLANSYLSGQTITFTATPTGTGFVLTPTITTSGGTTVPITDNGDNTYTFTMPQDDITASFAVYQPPATITLVAEAAGTMDINNKWTTPIYVENVTQGTSPITIAGDATGSIVVDIDDVITITESSGGVTFRTWSADNNRIKGIATAIDSRITDMPPMYRFTVNNDGQLQAGDYFFSGFCRPADGGGITSLPAYSFDISGIFRTGVHFFAYCFYSSKCTSLPSGSFRTEGIAVIDDHFFQGFNYYGNLSSLPQGSFRFGQYLTNAHAKFFYQFNARGKLGNLPTGSFDTSNIAHADDCFLREFNYGGSIGYLPYSAFSTIRLGGSVGAYFCMGFNEGGGKMARDTSQTNLQFRNITSTTIWADYWISNSAATYPVAPGEPFAYRVIN